MTKENEKVLEEKLIEAMCEMEFKQILETYDEIGDLYDKDEIIHDDFYNKLEELKERMLN